MGKKVVMFPGQGSQYISMGKESFDRCLNSVKCFDKASEITGIDIKKLVFEENMLLDKTEYTQIALYVTEMAMLADRLIEGLKYDAAIGLSLGEYSALTASGALSYEDGVRLVRKRGIYMENEVPSGIGAMAAVLGLNADETDNVLAEYNSKNELQDKGSEYPDIVSVANYNCPGQIVISGKKECVEEAAEQLKKAGAKRTVLLNVSGPFHSYLLKGAGEKLKNDLESINFEKIRHPYIANCTAEYIDENTQQEYIKELLSKQVYSPVYFEQSVRKLIKDGYDIFEEIGPKKTLSAFVKKIAKSMDAEVDIL